MTIISKLALESINKSLSYFYSYIALDNALGSFGINKCAESFLINVLDITYDLKLKNMNDEKKNYPAIDLGDRENRVSIQVTSETNSQKLKITLSKFKKYNLLAEYDSLYFIILSNDKVANIVDEEVFVKIINLRTLISDIEKLDYKKIYSIQEYLSANIATPSNAATDSILPQDIHINIDNIYMDNIVEFLSVDSDDSKSYLKKDLIELLKRLSVIGHNQRELVLYVILNSHLKLPNGLEYSDTLYMFDYVLSYSIPNSEMRTELLCQEGLMYKSDKYSSLEFKGKYQYLNLCFSGEYEINIFKVMKLMYGSQPDRLYKIIVNCDFSKL